MVSATRWAYELDGASWPTEQVTDVRCWLCGDLLGGQGLPRRSAICGTFTNHGEARVPSSNSICGPCAWTLAGKPSHDSPPIRMLSHLLTRAGHTNPSRDEIAALLVSPPAPPFALACALSRQKHLLFRTPINWHRDYFAVRADDLEVWVEPALAGRLIDAVAGLMAAGVGRTQIQSGRYHQEAIRRCGFSRWDELETVIRPHRATGLFALVVWATPKPEVE